MPILDFDKLTPDNQAVKDLKDLIQLTVFQNEDMERFMTFMPNVTNGKKAGFIGEMEDVGVAGSGCDPEYKKVAIAAAQKEWEIGDWQIPLEMCYTDLENTIAKYCLKTGTNIGDLTSTEYMDGIVLPKLSEAMMKMMWRFTWFGDKSAASVTGGGQITDGVNIELFKTCDGFFKRLFAICTNNTGQHTEIAAKRLKQWGMEYQSSVTHSASHAGYYPDALPLTLKLTFHPKTGKLYGAQCIGYEGVDKRIDQIAGLIKRGGTVYDLMETEHTYAPPFSSAKDPIAIGGYVASNIISGAMPVISWRELVEEKDKVMLIDTRTPEEFSFGTIPGAVNIPLDEMREHLAEIPTDKPVVLFCAVGLRGYLSLRILMGCGYRNVRNLIGGYKTYSTATAPLPSPSAPAGGGSSSSSVEAATDDVPADASVSKKETLKINACGLQCPGPIMQVKKAMDSIAVGERVEIVATDAGCARDASAWCDTTGNKLIEKHDEKGRYTVVIEKGAPACTSASNVSVAGGRGKTLILFSDDLDKALATFVLANGAAATGQKVTIFFTFWGLNVLKKVQKPSVQKDFFGKMFGMMLPSSSLKLKLSQMNMFGMGSRMMRFLMKRKGVDSLESLRSQALAQGVEFIACQMSMDMMGIQHEELLDEVTIGGVATYMERADKANVNLFI